MFRFVLKGILRDRSRSLFPIIVVSLIVALVIFNRGFLVGSMNGMFKDTAVISSGHVKVMTHAYQKESQLMRQRKASFRHFGLHQQPPSRLLNKINLLSIVTMRRRLNYE
jgi:hypothetical protein